MISKRPLGRGPDPRRSVSMEGSLSWRNEAGLKYKELPGGPVVKRLPRRH